MKYDLLEMLVIVSNGFLEHSHFSSRQLVILNSIVRLVHKCCCWGFWYSLSNSMVSKVTTRSLVYVNYRTVHCNSRLDLLSLRALTILGMPMSRAE